MQSQERFTITIEAMPKWTTPVAVRLKGVLKQLLRCWGFRCVSIAEVTETDDANRCEAES